jgi:nitrogen regulatory protein PII
MTTYPMKLVTIVCESLAREHVKRLLRATGAHGWTMFEVEGSGSRGERTGDIQEFGNTQIEVILQPAVAGRLLERLYQEFIPRFAMVVYCADIEVLRRDKF